MKKIGNFVVALILMCSLLISSVYAEEISTPNDETFSFSSLDGTVFTVKTENRVQISAELTACFTNG